MRLTHSIYKIAERIKRDTPCVVPIVLVRPDDFDLISDRRLLLILFNRYNRRSGRVSFFVPGYRFLRPRHAIVNDEKHLREGIFNVEGLGHIQFMEDQFNNFLFELEHENTNYHNYGDAELILVQFIPKTENEKASLDFSTLRSYNLSDIYNQGANPQQGMRCVKHFIEQAILILRQETRLEYVIDQLSKIT